MFNIGLSEILVIALVSIVILDNKNRVLAFIDLVRNIYRYFLIAKLRTKRLLKDTGIEDLYKEYGIERINYIVGEDSKFYPSYNVDSTSPSNDSEGSGNR